MSYSDESDNFTVDGFSSNSEESEEENLNSYEHESS